VHPAVAALSAEEKGLVLGALLGHTPAATVARRIEGPAGTRCAAALATLGEASKSERAGALAALLALVRSPVPSGLERTHTGWLRERFEREPSEIVVAVAANLPQPMRHLASAVLAARGARPGGQAGRPDRHLAPGGVAEVQRIVFAGFVPLSGPGAPAGPQARRLVALTPRALEDAIEVRGAETLGASLRAAPGPVVARAAAAIGDRLGIFLVRAAARNGAPDAREQALRLVAALGVHDPREAAWELGCRAVAGDLGDEGAGAIVAVAQRLPPPRGRRLLEVAGLGGTL
jgi:hypothetical protein